MTAPASIALSADDLEQVLQQASRLATLLEEEFEGLRQQDAARIEKLQDEKLSLLNQIASHAEHMTRLPHPPAAWVQIVDSVRQSRQAQQRNETLLRRQIDVVRRTLNALGSPSGAESVELYDRLGQMSQRLRGRLNVKG